MTKIIPITLHQVVEVTAMLLRNSWLQGLIALTIIGCSDPSEFRGSNAKFDHKHDSDAVGHREKKFLIESNRGSVDLVWLIDTSGSMREETANVKDNFSRFLTNLEQRTNVSLTLIASKSSITLGNDALSKGHQQIDKMVNSNDALVIAKDSLNKAVIKLRPDAKLVLVVVTDDNALRVTDQNFIEELDAHISSKNPVLFAFRGDVTKNEKCRVAQKGVAYEKLAQKTGGLVFDICDENWVPNFDRLVDSVGSIANKTFKIEDPKFKSIVHVIVDGKTIDPNSYIVNGPSVEIAPSALTAASKEVIIKYSLAN